MTDQHSDDIQKESSPQSLQEQNDTLPIEIEEEFKQAIRQALIHTTRKCTVLLEQANPNLSECDFWVDTHVALTTILRDIQIMTDPDVEKKF